MTESDRPIKFKGNKISSNQHRNCESFALSNVFEINMTVEILKTKLTKTVDNSA